MKLFRFTSALLVISLLLTLPGSAFALETDSDEVEKQRILAEADYLLSIEKNGELPKDLSLEKTYNELMAVDPELAEKVFSHLESLAYPAEAVGSYDEQLPLDPSTNDQLSTSPQKSHSFIANPQNGRLTSSICKVFATREGYLLCGSGFFVSDTVVATAAHCIKRSNWDDDDPLSGVSGWANEVYVMQAYNPDHPPFGRVFADVYNMRVGASWMKPDISDDDDWGVVVLNKPIQGNYSYLPKKQIDASSYTGQSVSVYGYPDAVNGVNQPMYSLRVTTVAAPDGTGTYRTVYATGSTSDNSLSVVGMSGSPVVDNNGYVVGIFVSTWDIHGQKYFCAVGFDYDLYRALKKYE